jgi:glycosyltransferase involved in cell wall biosynthesis
MKIAVWHNLPSGGGKRALYYHVRGLVQRGHTVEVWCPDTADTSYLPLHDLVTEHISALRWKRIDLGLRPAATITHCINQLRLLRALEEHGRRCAEDIATRDFDVVLANPCRFYRVPAIARYLKVPSVLYLQEPQRYLYEARPTLPWSALSRPDGTRSYSPAYLARWISNFIYIQTLRVLMREELESVQAFGTVLSNSFFSRESILRAYGLDSKVCYLGVDTKTFIDRDEPRDPVVVGVGSFTLAKNIEFVIRAMAHVRTVPRRLVWIGNIADRGYFAALQRLASSLDVILEPKLLVSDDELVTILNRASVMAYAPRLEPFGLAPLEANACGVPVVTVAEGGLRETVIHDVNGLVCEPDPQAVGTALDRLLGDSAYARRLGRTARQIVLERWSLEAAVTRLESRLAEALRS